MKIAVVGTGISGLTAAYLLHPEHEITVFEAQDRIGGHTVTSQIGENGGSLAVDAGFIVYNEANYANVVKFLSRLGVETQPSSTWRSDKRLRASRKIRPTSAVAGVAKVPGLA